MIGRHYAIQPPKPVDRRQVSRATLLQALKRSNEIIIELLNVGIKDEGVLNIKVPWANIPSDVAHFMTYLVAYEAHHWGQIVIVARELGHRLPADVTNGIWQWKKRHAETKKQDKAKRT